MKLYEIPRNDDRKPLQIVVKSRVRSRSVYVDLLDISEGGCKLRAGYGFGNVGEQVKVLVNGVHAPLGRIAWIKEKFIGIAFDGHMHPAVIDHLCKERDIDPSSLR